MRNLEQARFGFAKNPKQEDYDFAYALGMIRKEDLIIGASYEGKCRNASEAVWYGNRFVYKRTKFGFVYDDEIKYPTDELYYDVFIPWKLLDRPLVEIIYDEEI